ncbi:hypothetical protein ACSSV4_000613 [Roseovarius sp. MBR-154]|jgi:hypothetical protein
MLVGFEPSATAPRPAILRLTLPCLPAPETDEWGDVTEFEPWRAARLQAQIAGENVPAVAGFAANEAAPHWHALIEEIAPAKLYPDWRKVMTGKGQLRPLPKTYNGYGLDPDLLARVTGGDGGVTLGPAAQDGAPWRLRFENGNLTGVIMPRWMKLDESFALAAILEGKT